MFSSDNYSNYVVEKQDSNSRSLEKDNFKRWFLQILIVR